MRLTVLGNADRYLAPFSGGTSYLLEHEGARILLDAGQGARETLAAHGGGTVDAVWLSHFHFDHVLDLVTMRAMLRPDTRILVPRGERARLDELARAFVWSRGFDLGCPIVEVDEGDTVEVGAMRLTFARTQHSAPSMALRVDAPDASLTYASDTAACEALRDLAAGTDLLLMHALLPDVDPASGHARRHATARSSGALAREAEAATLLLSHRYHESRDEEMLREARASHADAQLARTGASWLIRRGSGTPS